jgi:hypothetical protein
VAPHKPESIRQTNRRWWLLGLVGAVLLGGVFVTTRHRGDSSPKTWDSRVAELVTFVEQERGLTFKHPVAFDFLTDDAFVALVSSKRPAPPAETRDLHEAVLRAKGYIGPNFSTASAEQDFLGSVAGFYSHDDKRMRVRGLELSAYSKLVLVHELTHALQDQRFGITSMYRKVNSDEEAFFVQSLLEGDARDIENVYYRSLSEADQKAIDHTEHPADKADPLAHTPDALQVVDGAPYEFGAQMVATLRHLGGVDRLNAAFRQAPQGEAAVMLPFAPAPDVSRPRQTDYADGGLGRTATPITLGDESVGPLSTFLTLSSRINPTAAWQAASGWGAERTRVVRKDDQVCVESLVRGRSPADTERLNAAYQLWSNQAAGATVTQLTDAISVQSCDPKQNAPEPRTGIFKALYLLTSTDLALFKAAEAEGLESGPASCAVLTAHQQIDGLTLDQQDLLDDKLSADAQAALKTAIAACR